MSNQQINDALAYARLGWHVFPVNAKTKVPLVQTGFHAATVDEDQIHQWWTKFSEAGIGVACLKSGIFVMDLDKNHADGRDGVMAWKFLCQDKGHEDNAELVAVTARGGRHIIYRRPDVPRVTTTNNIVPASGIDVRGDGGYIVVPSAVEPQRYWEDGDPFEVSPPQPPAWVTKMVATDEVRASGNPDGGMFDREMPMSQQEVAKIREALTHIDSDDHGDWIAVGMALRSTGAREQALAIWAEWSQTSPKWDEAAALRRWASMREFRFDGTEITLGSLFQMARDNGWMGDAPLQFTPPAEPVNPVTDAEVAEEEVEDPVRPFPSELLNFPGAVSDLASACIRYSRQSPQPGLAFASAIALVSTILNRRVKDFDGLMTQVYVGIIGPTGSGKDRPLKFPGEVLSRTGIERLKSRVGPSEFTSEAAFRTFLQSRPACIMAKDEAGKWLGRISSKNATGADVSAKGFILQLYSTDAGQTLEGTQYANGKERETIPLSEPSLTILGASTPQGFYEGGGSSASEDGFLNRFILAHADSNAPRKLSMAKASEHVSMDRAVEIVTELDSFFGAPSMFPTGDGLGNDVREMHEMAYTDAAEGYIDDIYEANRSRREGDIPTQEREMLARQVLNIKRVAMVLAAGQGLSNPITLEAVKAADLFVTWCMERAMQESSKWIGGDYAAQQSRILEWLKTRGTREFSRGDVVAQFRDLRPREIDELLKSMGDAGDIQYSVSADGNFSLK